MIALVVVSLAFWIVGGAVSSVLLLKSGQELSRAQRIRENWEREYNRPWPY